MSTCLIGETVRRELFGAGDAVGGQLRVKQMSCEVVGVLGLKGQGAFGNDQDDVVLLQFLIEAVVLAALGGLIGIVLATGASMLLAQVMNVPYVFNASVNLMSFVFSAGIGVLFGYFPARRAARMDPIEALRHE